MGKERGARVVRSSWPLRSAGDVGASLVVTVSTIFVLMMVTLLMVLIAMRETDPAAFQRDSAQSAAAARQGVQDVAGQLIAATDSTIEADFPCTEGADGPIQGSSSTDTAYVSTVQYFDANPVGQNDRWKASHQLACTQADNATFAMITTQGSVGREGVYADRALEAVYDLEAMATSTTTTPGTPGTVGSGGSLRFFNRGSPGSYVCMTALGTAVGSQVNLDTCNAGSATQHWRYTPDQQLQLVSENLCMQAAPGPTRTDRSVTLQPCGSAANQKWLFNTYGRIQVADSDNWGQCLNPTSSSRISAPSSPLEAQANALGGGGPTCYAMTIGAYGTGDFGSGAASWSGNHMLPSKDYTNFCALPLHGKPVAGKPLVAVPCVIYSSGEPYSAMQFYFDAASEELYTLARGNGDALQPGDRSYRYCLYPKNVGGAAQVFSDDKNCRGNRGDKRWQMTGTEETGFQLRHPGSGWCLGLNDVPGEYYKLGVMVDCSAPCAQWGAISDVAGTPGDPGETVVKEGTDGLVSMREVKRGEF